MLNARKLSPLVAGLGSAALAAAVLAQPAQAAGTGGPVTDVAQGQVPQVLGQQCYPTAGPKELCRQVRVIAKVGDWIYVGGQIDSVRSPITRRTTTGFSNLFRFNAVTKQLDTSFRPQFYKTAGRVDNGAVTGLAGSPDGRHLYVSGDFTYVRSAPGAAAVARRGVAEIDPQTGAVQTGFNARVCVGGGSCSVNDVRYVGSSLWISGTFTHVARAARTAMASVDPRTGALTGAVNPRVAGRTQSSQATRVYKMVPNPTNTKAVIIGNFGSVLGQSRYSVAMLNVSPTSGAVTSLNSWNAPKNLQAAVTTCNKNMFGPRDAAWSPSGREFAIVSKGVGGGHPYPALCDAFSIFSDNGNGNSQPFGYNHTEIDSVMSVCMLDGYAYVGGHFKSLNQERRLNGVVVRPPRSQVNETHYGMGVINPAPSNVLAVPGWNQTTATGRGAGWGAALCVDGPGSRGGGVYFGGDAVKVNGNRNIKKLAFFPAAG